MSTKLVNEHGLTLDDINAARKEFGLEPVKDFDLTLCGEEESERVKNIIAEATRPKLGYGDPEAMLENALARFEPVPEHAYKPGIVDGNKRCVCVQHRAQKLCQLPQYGGGRNGNPMRSNGVADKDVVIVLHPTATRTVKNIDGTVSELPAYIVFMREFSHTWRTPQGKSVDIWNVTSFAKAYSDEDAYEVAREVVAAWEATRQQEVEGWSTTELPFSPEFMDGLIEAKVASGNENLIIR